jgi:type II secretory pathway component PulF
VSDRFAYVAVDAKGRKVTGTLEASGKSPALAQLRTQGLTPVRVGPARASSGKSTAVATGNKPLRRRQAEDFCRELGHLLTAGISMSRALRLLAGQQAGPAPETLKAIHDDVTGGATLAEAMARQEGSFSRVQIAMVQAGEAGGFLDVVLGQIADFESRQRDLRTRIRGALAYPTVLVIVAAGVILFLLHFFIPRFSAMFDQMGGKLPLLTRGVVAVSQVVVDHGLASLLVIAVGVVLLRRWIQSETGRRKWQQLALSAPILGRISARLALVRFSRMLGTLLGSGVALVASLRVARQALGNQVLADTMTESIEDVVRGKSLAGSLRRCDKLFPASVVEMLAVAEEAGRLDQELQRLAEVYEKQLDSQVNLAVSLAEPAVLFLMAAIVGTVVIGMLLPIFTLQELIQ